MHEQGPRKGPDLIQLLLASTVLFLGIAGLGIFRPSWQSVSEPRQSTNPAVRFETLDKLGVRIQPREAWQACSMNGGTGSMGNPWRLTVHHQGVGPFHERTFDATIDALRSIQADHQDHRGWVDIGYHFVIDPAGRVWEGRPVQFVGAHAGNSAANKGNVGILLLGHFDDQELNADQRSALDKLLGALRKEWQIDRDNVLTHDEVRRQIGKGGTECPGKHLREFVEQYRGVGRG